MAVRKADAEWRGNLREGKGTMRMASGAYEGQYSFSSRFEEGVGTNPEELIAAAHAGCFSMQFAAFLSEAGHTPNRVNTTARVHLDKTGDHFSITRIELLTEAEVPGISEEVFQEQAKAAKEKCPVSRALSALEITVSAKLVGA